MYNKSGGSYVKGIKIELPILFYTIEGDQLFTSEEGVENLTRGKYSVDYMQLFICS